jgi:hypothetical protein
LTTDVRPVGPGLPALDNHHSSSPEFTDRVGRLSFESQCDVIDMIARPYWISLFARKAR